eukprot:COSAG04_NODE_8880_length_921_cov_1.250608_1_plen_126_part_10
MASHGASASAAAAGDAQATPPQAFAVGDRVSVQFTVGEQRRRFRGRVREQIGAAYVVHFEDGETWTVDPRRDPMRLISSIAPQARPGQPPHEGAGAVPAPAAAAQQKIDKSCRICTESFASMPPET